MNSAPDAGAYAGFWRRVAANLIDAVVVTVAGGIAAAILVPLAPIIGILVAWVYGASLESSSNRGTLGKMALGIVVTDESGQRISFGRASGRHFAMYLSTLILFIGYLMVLFTAKKQALHDMVAQTFVRIR